MFDIDSPGILSLSFQSALPVGDPDLRKERPAVKNGVLG